MARQHQQDLKAYQLSPPSSKSDSDESPNSPEETRKELQQAIEGSNQVLASANTVLAVFPDTMIVDRAKVTIIKRQFFRMAEIMSIRVEDILNATSTVGPFLGTVSIVSRVMNEDQTAHIGKFWRSDAKRLKRIIQGYVIALERNIDCNQLETDELSEMLEKLGADNHPDA
jgi:hypothetical protein